jgi:hypothetical protein
VSVAGTVIVGGGVSVSVITPVGVGTAVTEMVRVGVSSTGAVNGTVELSGVVPVSTVVGSVAQGIAVAAGAGWDLLPKLMSNVQLAVHITKSNAHPKSCSFAVIVLSLLLVSHNNPILHRNGVSPSPTHPQSRNSVRKAAVR